METRIIDLTVGELMELLSRQQTPEVAPKPMKHLEYGIAGIAKTFNCSLATANKIKQSGRIDKAISQIGRIITLDVDLALELMKSPRIG